MNVQGLERIFQHYLASEGGLTLVANFSGAVLSKCTLKEQQGNSLLTVTYDNQGVSFYVSCSGQRLPVKYNCSSREVPELEKWYQRASASMCSNAAQGTTIPSSVTWIGGFTDPPPLKKPAQNKKTAMEQVAA